MPTANLAEAQSHPITPDDFLEHDSRVRVAKREKDDLAFGLATAKKDAKAAGVNMKAYRIIEMLRQLEDDEQIIVVRNLWQYTKWLEMPIGTQFSMLDAPKVPKPRSAAKAAKAARDAGEQGLKAGRDGEAASANPYEPGSEMFAAWSTRHTDGLAERATAARMQDTEDERPADVAEATRKAGQGRGGRGRQGAAADNSDVLAAGRLHLSGGTVAH